MESGMMCLETKLIGWMLPLELSRSQPDTCDSFPPLRGARGNRTGGFGFLPSHRPASETKEQQKENCLK